MNGRLFFILPLFLLAGCLDEWKPKEENPKCFEIIDKHDGPPPSPILLDKCKGETWMLLRSPIGKDSYTYRWFRMEVMAGENTISSKD